ncbi:hypothetical protein D3C87_1188050 [compost metagenome]
MADIVFTRCTTTTGGIDQTVVADFRAVVVDAEDRVIAVVEGPGEAVVRGVFGIVTAQHHFMLHG